jgi:hypothetical protein
LPGAGADHDGILRQVQKEQNGGIALQRQAGPFAETVNGEVQIARLRASPCVAFTFGGGAIDPLLEFSETHDIASGFKAHAHFIAVVCAIKHEAVDAGAN